MACGFVNTSRLKRSLLKPGRTNSVFSEFVRPLVKQGSVCKNLRFASTGSTKMKREGRTNAARSRTNWPLAYTRTNKRYELLGTLRRPKRAPQASIFQRRGERLFDPRARTYTKIHMHMRAHAQKYLHTCAQVLIHNMHT